MLCNYISCYLASLCSSGLQEITRTEPAIKKKNVNHVVKDLKPGLKLLNCWLCSCNLGLFYSRIIPDQRFIFSQNFREKQLRLMCKCIS